MTNKNESQAHRKVRGGFSIAIALAFIAFSIIMVTKSDSLVALGLVLLYGLIVAGLMMWYKKKHGLIEEKSVDERWMKIERLTTVVAMMGFAFFILNQNQGIHWILLFFAGSMGEIFAQFQSRRWVHGMPVPKKKKEPVKIEQIKPDGR